MQPACMRIAIAMIPSSPGKHSRRAHTKNYGTDIFLVLEAYTCTHVIVYTIPGDTSTNCCSDVMAFSDAGKACNTVDTMT